MSSIESSSSMGRSRRTRATSRTGSGQVGSSDRVEGIDVEVEVEVEVDVSERTVGLRRGERRTVAVVVTVAAAARGGGGGRFCRDLSSAADSSSSSTMTTEAVVVTVGGGGKQNFEFGGRLRDGLVPFAGAVEVDRGGAGALLQSGD